MVDVLGGGRRRIARSEGGSGVDDVPVLGSSEGGSGEGDVPVLGSSEGGSREDDVPVLGSRGAVDPAYSGRRVRPAGRDIGTGVATRVVSVVRVLDVVWDTACSQCRSRGCGQGAARPSGVGS